MARHIYSILQNPGHNRVYYQQSRDLSLAELSIACGRFDRPCHQVGIQSHAEITYFSFELEGEISEKELLILSRLSFIFALFEVVKVGGKQYLQPVPLPNNRYIDDKISSLLKYSGKTNELFTRMMLNVALLSSDFGYEDNIQVLDPVAGKGTTLFEGAVQGFDVFGIEIEPKSAHEAGVFFKKYLERERYKHLAVKRKFGEKPKANSCLIQEFEYAHSKEAFKQTANRKKLVMVSGDASEASRYFKKNRFHIIVGDLPYGIAHGNVAPHKASTLSRSPYGLLNAGLSDWYKVLHKGGVLVLAWNTFVMPKNEVVSVLQKYNFEVFNQGVYAQFSHRVDMAIKRDIVVAKKMG